MTKIFLPALMLLSVLNYAQDIQIKYAKTITKADLKKHLTIIASDEFEGRETGTEGQRKAAAYIEQQFKNLGLPAVPALKGYQQLYPLYRDSMISSTLSINKKTLTYGTDYYTSAQNNLTATVNGKKIIFVGYGIKDEKYNDYANLNVKGKIVVFFLGEPKTDGKYVITGTTRNSKWTFPGVSEKMKLATEMGAAGAIVISPASENFSEAQLRTAAKTNLYFPRNTTNKNINYVIVNHAIANNLGIWSSSENIIDKAKKSESLASTIGKEIKAKFTLIYKKEREQINASNVVGIIEGSDKKDEYVFITGHYDHLGKRGNAIYYGADDDGSGTCAVIEIAEAFAKARAEGHGPRRTVICMTVSGEEKGLWGSEYYSDHPFVPLDKTSVDLNIDMIGRIDTERMMDDSLNYVYTIGHDKLSTELPIINEANNNKYTQLVLDYKYDDPKDVNQIYFRSDHYNFARKGIPILFFYDGMLKSDYHKPTDTVDKIYWDLYEKRARMIFYTAWEMANRDAMLKRDIPLQDLQRSR